MKLNETLFQMIFEASPDATIVVDSHGAIMLVNKQAELLTGYTREELIDNAIELLLPQSLHDLHIMHRLNFIKHPVARPMGNSLNLCLLCKNKTTIPVEIGLSPLTTQNKKLIVIANIKNITFYKRIENKFQRLALHDPVTGLHNRVSLEKLIERSIRVNHINNNYMAFLYIDIDQFKKINDQYGHAAGDTALQEVATRLKSSVRKTDVIARVGGDEFIMLFNKVDQLADIQRIVEKILADFQQPFNILNIEINISISIGITIYPQDGVDAETLSEKADRAMYAAKRQNNTHYCFASLLNERPTS